jgi:hypothetical protein
MAGRNLPRVKQRVRCIDLASARRVAAEIMLLADEQRIARRIDDYNALL